MFRKLGKPKTELEIESATCNKDGSSGSYSYPELISARDFANAYYNAVGDEKYFKEAKSKSEVELAAARAERMKEFLDETDYEPWGFGSRPELFRIMVTGRFNGVAGFEKQFAATDQLRAFLLENKLTTEKVMQQVFAEDAKEAAHALR